LSILVEKPEEKKDEKASAPKFNPGLQDQQLSAGQPLNLFCKVGE
jgi:hypothetical protein